MALKPACGGWCGGLWAGEGHTRRLLTRHPASPVCPPPARPSTLLQSFPGLAGSAATVVPEGCNPLLLSKRYATFK